MLKETYSFLDKLGAVVLSLFAVGLFVSGMVMLVVFWPLGIGLLLGSIACAVMGKR